MDRLTKRSGCAITTQATIKELGKKLTEYEDLEEQGRLIKLPCGIGYTAYFIHRGEIHEDKIKTISFEFTKDYISIWLEPANADLLFCLDKTVFLTKEKAEAELDCDDSIKRIGLFVEAMQCQKELSKEE